MNAWPDVAVVITTCNRPDYLCETIESVISQDYSGMIDILVVDDGSANSSEPFVVPYIEKTQNIENRRVRFVYQENQGLAMARNTGVRETEAPLICFVDDDDLCEPGKVRRQVELFQGDEEIGLVHTSFRYIDRDGRFTDDGPQRVDNPCKGWCAEVLLNELVVISSTVMVRRDVLMKAAAAEPHGLPYGPEWVRSQDYDMALRMARLSKFGYIAEPLLRYRFHSGNIAMSEGNLKKAFGYHCRVQLSFVDRYGPEIGVDESEIRRRVARFLFSRAESFFWQRRFPLVKQMAELAEELEVDEPRFADLVRRASRPLWMYRIKDFVDGRILRRGGAGVVSAPGK